MKIHLMFLAALPFSAVAGQLTYEPINPAFGGSYLNGSYLLQNAGAQNSHTGPERIRTTTSTAERFARSLESRLTSQLLSDLSSDSGLSTGSLTTSDFVLDIEELEDGSLNLTIEDKQSGGDPININVQGFSTVTEQ